LKSSSDDPCAGIRKNLIPIATGRLKSSAELSLERIIAPRKKMNREDYSDFQMPDFVEAWKTPHGPDEFQAICLESDGSNETKSLIDNYNHLKPKEDTKQDEEETIKIQESDSDSNTINIPSVHWHGEFLGVGGPSKINRTLAFGLANRGFAVKTIAEDECPRINEETENKISEMNKLNISNYAPRIFTSEMRKQHFGRGKKILYYIDFTKKIDNLNAFDEIWVISEAHKVEMQRKGVKKTIKVIPVGTDFNRYNPKRKSFNFNQEFNEFIFLSIGETNYELLLKSFMEEFSSEDNVSLLIVSKNNKVEDAFSRVRTHLEKEDQDLPHVSLYKSDISEKDMPSIYGSSDALCFLSKYDSIYCQEAGASCLPVIAKKSNPHVDFLNSSNSFLFKDPKEIKTYMRHIYGNYEKSLDKSVKLRKDLKKEYSWEKSIDKIYGRLMDFLEEKSRF